MRKKSITMSDLPTFIFVALICAVFISGCGNGTNQSNLPAAKNGTETNAVEENESEENKAAETTADAESKENEALWAGYIMDFTDLDSMGESFRVDWQSQLGETVYSYGGCRSLAQEYMASPKNSDEERDFLFYFYTLDEFSIPTFYKTTAYGYIADGTAYIMRQSGESFEEITTGSQANELAEIMSSMFAYQICLADYKEEDGNLATIISKLALEGLDGFSADEADLDGFDADGAGADGTDLDGFDADGAGINGVGGMAALSTPETAIEKLLHYSGGSAESVPWEICGNSRITTCTFADGGRVIWDMSQDYEDAAGSGRREFWFPSGYCSEETLETAEKIQKYMTDVSVYSLKGLTKEPDFADSAWMDEWMTLPENEDEDMFVLLYEDDKEDIALYGLYGGSGIILRDGLEIYPVYTSWMRPLSIWPVVKKADYDNDGVKEYALWMVLGTGTGFHWDGLFMLEPDAGQDTGLRVNEFATDGMLHQFDVIDYTFDEETNILKVDTGAQSVEMDLTEFLKEQEEGYTGLGWGDLVYIEEKDGQWYITMTAGIMLADFVQPSYECGMDFTAPITYMENGDFQVGDIGIELIE